MASLLGVRQAHGQQAEPTLPISQRQTINLAAGVPEYIGDANSTSNAPQSQWWFENTNNSTTYSTTGLVESSDTSAKWMQVGLPYDANITRTFINQTSGGGQGSLTGNFNWYRLHFKVDPKYAGQKFLLNIEGSHTGVQVFINGTLLQGISAVAADAQATHVVGFVPVICDLTPYIHTDGVTDNVIAIDVSRGAPWYEQPDFSGAFRFGQAMAGLFRNVYLYVTNPVHIPQNVYSNQKTWGTYVGTVSEVPAAEGTATAASAVVDVQTNVVNESGSAQQVTLTTQIVDAQGNVVVTAPPITQTVPAMTAATFPSGATPMFDQKITIQNPTLWYPNNSIYGKPYLYKVYHIVSVNGVVVDSAQSTLGIRTITWDANFPYFNGHATYLWGGASRYDYPALGSSVPDEQWWRDMAQIAAQGGNVWRPGHSTSSEEMVEAADAYGIMIDQPSGDGEGGWNAAANPTADDQQLKQELHRDMIIRDRSHPSILDWERDNGGMNTTLAGALGTLETTWDNINPRVSADRTFSPAFGFMDECDGAGCEAGNKTQNPNNPAFGAEYWDNMGTGRGLAYDSELAFAAPYLDDWRQGREANAFGMAQWYFAESPGEVSLWAEYQNQPQMVNFVRSLGYSSVDANRFPRLLYYIYQANWTPYSIQPVVHLAHHWNRSYEYTQGTPIQENAFSNCPAVRLLINGVAKDPVTGAILPDQTPNPWNINSHADMTQNTTVMPGQVHWMVNWAPGTVTAECIDANGNPVSGVTDTRTTAGAENKIVLSVVPEVTKPDGTSFQWTANGSDAAFVVAQVEDANGNLVPTAADNVTFSVTGPATYMGGTQQLVADPTWTSYYQDAFSQANSTVIQGVPYAFFHSPGDPELNFEGGLQKIALRSTFAPGTITVTASAPGLASGSVTLTSVAPPAPSRSQPPAIIVPPVNTATTLGYPATFMVAASGSGTLSYQWSDRNGPISGATNPTYTTPATTAADNGDTFTVTVTSNFGSVTSNPVTLTVAADANVAINTQPVSQTVVVGQSATLTVGATGSPTLTYQWYQVGSGAIQGATQASYATPVFTATGTQSFYVVVTNPLGQVQSSTAVVTVTAPIPVSFTTQPAGSIVPVNEPVQLTAIVAGSAPYTYQWQFTPTGGKAIILTSGTQLSSTISYTIPAVSSANVGAYAVTVNNAANAPATSNAAQITLAPPGVNLALGKTATSSSTQNACNDATTTPPFTGTGCLGPENAVDGNLATRWGSATAGAPPTPPVAGVDPSWLQVDLGSVQPFNTVIINWENASAAQYQILYTNQDPSTNPQWQTATTNNMGVGGTETLNFPTVSGRYIRMNGTQRTTQYGYSMYEFQVYNVAQCGGSNERYTVNSSNSSLVNDNQSGLTWTRTVQTDTAAGSQFTGVDAQNYCKSLSMRLPTQSEALGISGVNNASCAFPGVWSTWTSTVDPNDSTKTAIVNFDGTSADQVTVNYPGATLCVSGTGSGSTAPPTITAQPTAQSVTAGQTATFSVTATGTGTLAYQWSKNGNPIAGARSSSYTTAATTTADNGSSFSVAVSNAGGTVISNSATLTVISAACNTAPSVPGTLTASANASSQINLTWGASTAGTGCAVSYNVYRGSTAAFTPSSANQVATTTGTTYSDTGLAATTTYYYIVEATDSAGTSAASNTASATTPQAGCTSNCGSDVLAISAGGPAAGSFAADEDFIGGAASGTGATINTSGVSNPAPQSVYQHQRVGNNFTYTLPGLTPGASYLVRLHFAEFYWTQSGQRVFNASINGTQVLNNFDIIAAAGGPDIAIVEQFTATANAQGQIALQFTTDTDNAEVNGIEVLTSTASNTQPNAPTNLTATVASSSQINLSWTASSTSGVTYSVLRNGTVIANNLTATTYTDSNLTAATTYSYTVEALDSAGTSLASNTATATTFDVNCTSGCGSDVIAISAGGPAAGDFAADEDFNGGAASGTGATINTSGVSNPAPQSVYQHQRSGNNFTYTLPGLTPGASYTVRLHFDEFYWTKPGQRVFNVSINGTQVLNNFDILATAGGQDIAIVQPFTATADVQGQIVVQFTTITDNAAINGIEVIAAPPVAPANLTATVASSSQINLNWTASSAPGVVYDVFRSTTSGFTPSSANQIATATGTTYSDTGLAGNTTYYYVVEASNASGTSAPTPQASASIAIPVAPSNLTATAGSSSQINLSWTASTTSGVTYTVLRSGTAVANGLTGTTYTDTALTASTTYSYTVEAVNSVGASPVSNTATATTATAIPVAPTNLTATAASSSQINLSWTASATSGVTYTVLRNGTAVASGLTGITYSDTGLTASTTYSYTVEAVNSAGTSPVSNTATATTATAIPVAPTNLTATAASSTQINLSWTASSTSGVTYTVLRNGTAVATGLTGTTYTDTGLTASTTYSYTVDAVNAAGTSAASNTASATTSVAGCTTNCGSDVIAISAGGPGAGNFAADEDFNGGNTSGNNATINTSGVTNPAPLSVYQHQRYGNFTYTLPGLTPAASFTVRLHFAENYWTQPGQRVFNVSVNGTQVLTNFDMVAAAGGQNIAIAEQFTATANAQGQIVIQFTTVKDNAEVSGIEVLSASASTMPPAAPSNLTATVASSSQINLSWTASATSGVTYTVLRNGTAVASGLTGTTYTDTGLAASTTYSYTVEAVDSAGTSIASNTATATTLSAGCTTNCGSDVIAISAGGPAAGNFAADEDFNGGAASGTGATINTSGVSNPAPQSVYQHQRSGNNFTYTLPGLTPGASYTVRLHFDEFYWTKPGQRVFNVSINGTQVLSNFDILATAGGQDIAIVQPFTATANAQGQIVLQFTTITDNAEVNGIEVLSSSAPTTPAAPSNLTATVASSSQINLSWTASATSGVTYTVLRNGTTIASGLTGTTYTDTGLTASTNYSYTVEAVDAAGTSPVSNTATATTSAANTLTITTQPANQTASVGNTATFNVVAGGTGPFTYQWLKNGTAIPGATSASYTTPNLASTDNGEQFSVTVGNASGTVTSTTATLTVTNYTIYPGFIGVDLNNNTNGAWADNQVYVTVIGIDPSTNQFAYLKFDGTIVDFTLNDASAANHLTGPNGQSYGNYSFTLAQSKLLKIPTFISARAYISLGNPLYVQVNGDGKGNVTGYAGPNPQNGTDPNVNTHFDWYEFNNNNGIFINTTQVDEFGLPLLLDVWGAGGTFHQQVGITESIAQLDSEFSTEVPAQFQPTTMSNLRIFSPAKLSMAAGGANANYFANYIATAWQQFNTTPLTVTLNGRQFSGTTSGSTFTFTEVNPASANAGEVFVVQQPSTQDILGCAGTMASGVPGKTPQLQDENAIQLQLENQICSATNRGVLLTPANWANASTYYQSPPANFYSSFWHKHSIGGLAYGFSYDDNNNQSTTVTTPQPEHMAFGIGW